MKRTIIFSLIACLLQSCTQETETEQAPQVAAKSVIHALPALSGTPIPSFSLNPKLRCGLVADLDSKMDTIGYHTYINDTLFGPVFSQYGTAFNEAKNADSPTDGFYVKGQKQGQFNFYNEHGYLNTIAYFEANDTVWKAPYYFRWKAFPFRYLVTTYKDEVQAELRHPNGELWYKGEFRKQKPKGEHDLFRRDGSKIATIDYNDWTLARYNRDEELQHKGIIRTSWSIYIGH